MSRRWLLLPLLTVTLAAGAPALPPEAYGTFVETNNTAFINRLEVRTDGVTLFVGVALPGARGGRPLACRGAPASKKVVATMRFSLVCAGESIPFRFQYRADKEDWVVSEDGAAPQIFKRQ